MSHEGISRRQFLGWSAATAAALVIPASSALGARTLPHPLAAAHPADVALRWVRAAYLAVRHERLSPPSAARIYAHLGIALYEAIVGGMPSNLSLAGQLNGLRSLPVTAHPQRYDWPSLANAAAWAVLSHDLSGRPGGLSILADVETTVRAERSAAGIPAEVLSRSISHGVRLGAALIDWIDTDGWGGIQGRPFTPPVGEGLWVRTPPNFGASIEPYWGEVRFLALDESDPSRPQPHVPFSSETASAFWHQANATYQAGLALTDEQKATALYWRDNPDGSAGLPSGHWMLIGAQVIADRGLDLGRAAEAFAQLGIGLADAFSSCWREKYRSNLLRPVTYIQRHIDPSWNSFVNSPAFPEYTSGHSVGSGAAAALLTDMFGETVFTDTAAELTGHTPRIFSPFTAAAEEAAISRLYGGIHYPMGIEVGLEQGRNVAAEVIARIRTRRGR